jgi:GT2 family glycosyltransferase
VSVTGDVKATVIIVNYNGAHLLRACLDGLAAQRVPEAPFDTVVVDNASTDGSLDLLRTEYPWVQVQASATNLGFAGGNNVALRQVRTPYAVLLNNDAVPEPGWLANLLAVFSQPGNEDVAIVTGKIVFLPEFATVGIRTPGFSPSTSDSRELGAQIFRIEVDGEDVTDKVIAESTLYGPEGSGDSRFRWSRPAGDLLIPLPQAGHRPCTVTVSLAAERAKPFELLADGAVVSADVDTDRRKISIELGAETPRVNVINNVGGQVFAEGSGGDRGFREVDRGQYEQPMEVFTACGNGMAMRTAVGHELGWFDGAFFMYYEDTDLSWRWRSAGWTIRYEPTAVLRHIHSASSKEWSPRWVFHVERNRLLMLTKNAGPGLAGAALGDYLRATTTAWLLAGRDAALHHRRPPARALLLKLTVIRSYLRHLPGALRSRFTIRRHAVVGPKELQKWLVQR